MADPFDLGRFVAAQSPVYARVVEELRAGQKRTHWMWFIFPQIAGLGQSETARHFAIASANEARAYLAHSTLGARLHECTQLTLVTLRRSANQIFGSIDELKFRSSLTLFAEAAPDNPVFVAALLKYFAGEADQRTVELLRRNPADVAGQRR